jgi:cytosine/adenosine deaminase-related metal-dependent hydrolase
MDLFVLSQKIVKMRTVIQSSAVIVGDNMEILEDGYVLIENRKIIEVSCGQPPRAERVLECRKCVVVPGLINAHTHIGDSAFKDSGYGKTLDELFRPPDGLKHRFLRETSKERIVEAIRDTITDMQCSGITTFADFREGEVKGVNMLLEAINKSKIRSTVLGRSSYAFTQEQLKLNEDSFPEEVLHPLEDLLKTVDGLAPSSPNDLTDVALSQIATIAKKYGKLKAIHVAEHPTSLSISKRRTGLTEVERALKHFEADLLVHLVYATPEDLDLVANNDVSVVCCPRSNAILGLKLPPIPEMIEKGINVALGTDNVMLNPPDMFREMEFALKAYSISGLAKTRLSPKEVLKMATINGARALGIENVTGSISERKDADLVILDFDAVNLRHTKDILVAVVHRARPSNVKFVLIEGEVVYDRYLEFK